MFGKMEAGRLAGKNGGRGVVGLKETMAHSALFVDGSGHFDVEMKVDDPDGGIGDIHRKTLHSH